LNLLCDFEKVRFDALEQRRKIQVSGESGDAQLRTRASLATLVSEQRAVAQQALLEAKTRYLQYRPVASRGEVDEEALWFRDNCTSRAEKIFAAYKDLREDVLEVEVFYEPTSLRKIQDVIKTVGFAPSGHHFNCENGHTFGIGECGEAAQASSCPECGAPIGGTGYRLRISTTRAIEFEQLLTGSGAGVDQ